MYSKYKTLLVAILATLILAGCASSSDDQRELKLMADRRAGILASSLPIEYGPLTITRATAKDTTVIIEMLYNQSGSKPADKLVQSASDYYCSSEEIRASMDKGINYFIKVRNNRGQMVIQQGINAASCAAGEKKATK
ncbi:GspS/AspS pilotin family protein [Vibrio rarus]|uniref:GspS/AspS pilotin family protein n=1 Tax=Vibrio rarus TaxID=413403 RepID=UPI0021C2E753|nr:GspS/AspS pilotin family protein [Vibrio rarus]